MANKQIFFCTEIVDNFVHKQSDVMLNPLSNNLFCRFAYFLYSNNNYKKQIDTSSFRR